MTTSHPGPALLDVAATCEQGAVRRRNEDACRVEPDAGVFVVADGVGGGPAGDVASQVAVDEVAARLRQRDDGFGAVRAAVLAAHDELRRRATLDPSLRGMATTVVVACVERDALVVGHVGDSRAYLRQRGSLRRLTDDHGVGSVLTQALGQPGRPHPELVEVPLRDAELLLLCTDGITDVLDDDTIAAHAAGAGPDELCDDLVAAAVDRGTRDNMTVVAVDLDHLGR